MLPVEPGQTKGKIARFASLFDNQQIPTTDFAEITDFQDGIHRSIRAIGEVRGWFNAVLEFRSQTLSRGNSEFSQDFRSLGEYSGPVGHIRRFTPAAETFP